MNFGCATNMSATDALHIYIAAALSFADICGRHAEFAVQVGCKALAFGRHVRIQLIRVEAELGLDHVAGPLKGDLERKKAHQAVWTRDIGDEINCHLGHGRPFVRGDRSGESLLIKGPHRFAMRASRATLSGFRSGRRR